MILVPRERPRKFKVLRMLKVFANDDAPTATGEVVFDNVRVPPPTASWGRGGASRSPRGRLGPAASTIACDRSAWPSARWS